MSRIPFRLLGRPHSGKHSRFRNTAPVLPTVVEVAPEPEATTAEPEQTLEDVIGSIVDPEPVPAPPAWDASWTKAQLLVVSQSKGLSVTTANTKAEIVAALTAAG